MCSRRGCVLPSVDSIGVEMDSREESVLPSDEEIEKKHAHTISLLLEDPSLEAIQAYYSRLAQLHNHQVEVQYISTEMGKGVFAGRHFEENEVVLKEHMLVGAQHTRNKDDALVCSFCFCFVGSIELQIGRRLLVEKEGDCAHEDEADESGCIATLANTEAGSEPVTCHSADCSEKWNIKRKNLPPGFIESLLSENFRLPYTDCFPLPPVVDCLGGCSDELFCSQVCAEAAWESYHSLLCTGPKSLCKKTDLLCKFKHHADETNDIFHVAAKVIASTILSASKLKSEAHNMKIENTLAPSSENETTALLKAWEPFSVGYKRLWWDSLALPADLGPGDELEFRKQIKDLSLNSLNLLKDAIFQEDYAPLFSLQVYGHIIGMFDLNNLDLVVASPVEDYFIFLDERPLAEKIELEKATRPLLEALGDEYDIPCQGTAFFPFQSCFNHSCCPNVRAFKRDEDKDGQPVLLATRAIEKGDEITMSYIDENLPWEERKAMLEDYGFLCHCSKCVEEGV